MGKFKSAVDVNGGLQMNEKIIDYAPVAGLLAQKAIFESGLSQPYGGNDWPQKSGYEIRHEIYRSTKRVIHRIMESDNL